MIRDRGLAVLAIVGNIATAWSWFGVNELGIGLHAYSDFEKSAKLELGLYVLSQLVIVIIGCLPLVGVRQTSGVRGVVNPERNRRKTATRKSDTL
jgi:hypothetical protein